MPSRTNNYSSGMDGQLAAEKFLQQKGYGIMARNYRVQSGEIDLVARYGTYIIFVEVKTRTSRRHGRPAEAVNYPKQQKIISTAKHYITRHQLDNQDFRFDVVEVQHTPSGAEIIHIEDAFWLG